MSATAPARTGGEWVAAAVRAEGVRHAFGIPGVHNLAVYDALLGQSAIRHVLARHEQGAAFMADGYARSSGHPGVVLVTTGPGATNTLTPLAEAYAGSIPVLVVMSDIPAALVGRDLGALHEVPNQIDCFRPVCRWAEAITDGADSVGHIQGAFDLFSSGRPGPIALSIPTDLLGGRVPGRLVEGRGRGRPPCHVEEIEAAARLLRAASRPLIISGGGTVAAEASGELRQLAHRLGAPVVTTVMGRGALPETDPLWQGVLPNKRATESAIRAADVARLIAILRGALGDDAIVVNDQTGINYWMEWRFPVLAPRTFLYPVGSATLGYAVPAAIGAKLANPDRQVVAVVGDGGFLFSVNELATAVKYGLGIVFLVLNDDRYGAIPYLQARLHGRSGETELANPDFPALARAFGAAGERVESLDALGGLLARALAAKGPTVLELPMAVEPPWEL